MHAIAITEVKEMYLSSEKYLKQYITEKFPNLPKGLHLKFKKLSKLQKQ